MTTKNTFDGTFNGVPATQTNDTIGTGYPSDEECDIVVVFKDEYDALQARLAAMQDVVEMLRHVVYAYDENDRFPAAMMEARALLRAYDAGQKPHVDAESGTINASE